MAKKVEQDVGKKQGQEPELSEATLAEVSGGSMIEDLQGAAGPRATKFQEALITEVGFPKFDASSKEAEQSAGTVSIRTTTDAEKGN